MSDLEANNVSLPQPNGSTLETKITPNIAGMGEDAREVLAREYVGLLAKVATGDTVTPPPFLASIPQTAPQGY